MSRQQTPNTGNPSSVAIAESWRNMKIEWVPIGELKPHPRNSRKHDDAQVEQLRASVREFGIMRPILVDEGFTILAGHGLWMALRAEGHETVPVIRRHGLTETQKRAYVIADNKLAMNSAWDDAILRAELGELKTVGFDLKLAGFGDLEVVRFLNAGTEAASANEDSVPEQQSTTVSRAGDVWICGEHRICCGDATAAEDVRRLLAGRKPVVMVTDPPYGVNYDPAWRARAGVSLNKKKLGAVRNDDRADWREAWALFPGNVLYVWHGGLHSGTVEASIKAAGFVIRAQIIWVKDRFALSRGDYHWQHEPCWYAVREGKPGRWAGDRAQSTTWEIPAREDSGHGHGTQKPVECMRRGMLNSSGPGDLVYDPFLGSGTSVIAAETAGRACLGMELSPAYVDIAVRRWQEFTGKNATLEASGQPFDATAAARARQRPKAKKPRKPRPAAPPAPAQAQEA